MADDDDLDYSDTNVGSAQAQTVRKNISLKLKGKGRGSRGKRGGRGRRSSSKKLADVIDDDEESSIVDNTTSETTSLEKPISELISLEDVISKLETPAFSPMDRAFPEPMHQNKKLRWNHKVNLIGEKVVNPMIHSCEKCSLPILNYGRMIPCKHVFCFDCARKSDELCPKCEDKVQRVEQASLGTVFMCIYGGSRYGPVACGRTYLSQRDLQAHINHRHLKTTSSSGSSSLSSQVITSHSAVSLGPTTAHMTMARDPRDPRGHMLGDVSHSSQSVMVSHSHGPADHRDQSDHTMSSAIQTGSSAAQQRQYPHSPANYSSTIPVSSARPNLITVPIQDDSSSIPAQHVHSQQSHTAQQYPPTGGATTHPPPSHQHPTTAYPPPPHYQHTMPSVAPAYSQAPPMTTQTFTSHPPPQVHHPPPMHTGPATLYSTPPPVHNPPPLTYSAPQTAGNPHSSRTLPPQRFPTNTGYEDSYQLQPWNATGVPPPTRGALPPRPIAAPSAATHPHIPPRGPSDPNYRPPYYQ